MVQARRERAGGAIEILSSDRELAGASDVADLLGTELPHLSRSLPTMRRARQPRMLARR
jgi:hypothetical protein